MIGIKLMEAMEGHDSLFANHLLGMGKQLHDGGQHCIDEISVDELAYSKQGSAHCVWGVCM